jgi:hypothetical protein
MGKLDLEIIPQGDLNHLSVEATLRDDIVLAQQHSEGVGIIKQKLIQGEEKYKCFQVDSDGVLWFNKRLVLPKDHKLRKQIMDEAHLSNFLYIWVVRNVPRSETKLLVDSYEMRNCQVRLRM